MALFTSTPKSKAAEKVPLLETERDDLDSSGYDSPTSTDDNKHCVLPKTKVIGCLFTDDSDESSDENVDDESVNVDEDDDDLDELKTVDSNNDSMKVTNTKALIENIRYILSMPNLCDVTFLVGPQRVPIHGLKSILGTRSMAFFSMFLKRSIDEMNKRIKKKKVKDCKTDETNKTTIIIDSYSPDVFGSFVTFLHCGSVIMNAFTVTGLLCCAEEFDIADLKIACWEFIDTCLSTSTIPIVLKETDRYGDHSAAQKIRQTIIDRHNGKSPRQTKTRRCVQRQAPIGSETDI